MPRLRLSSSERSPLERVHFMMALKLEPATRAHPHHQASRERGMIYPGTKLVHGSVATRSYIHARMSSVCLATGRVWN